MKFRIILSVFLFTIVLANDLQGQSDEWTRNFPKKIEKVDSFPEKEKLWVFVMAGQSNMAGRGLVEPEDTIANPRIIALNNKGEWIKAKEPLHLYQPKLTGLDMGISFASELLKKVDKDVAIALVPIAMGGSSIDYWLNDKEFHGVNLLTNLEKKVQLALDKGSLKGILWHQGESDAFLEKIPGYEDKLEILFQFFRSYSEKESLPIVCGELGSFSPDKERNILWGMINRKIEEVAHQDPNLILVRTGDLKAKSDNVHFNAQSQRTLGIRYAKAYLQLIDLNSKT